MLRYDRWTDLPSWTLSVAGLPTRAFRRMSSCAGGSLPLQWRTQRMDTDYATSVQQAADSNLLKSLPLHNRTRLLTFPLRGCLSNRADVREDNAQAPGDVIAGPGVWAGFSMFIEVRLRYMSLLLRLTGRPGSC